MRRIILAAIVALCGCTAASIESPTQVTTTFDGTYAGPVTLKDGGSSCPVPDRDFVLNIDNGRASNGWPFVPNIGMVWPDGRLDMIGRAYQMNERVGGQFTDGTYNALSSGGNCTYLWHLRRDS